MLKIKNWNVMGQENKNKEVYQKFLEWDKLSDIDKKTTIMEIIDMNPKSLKYIHSKVETIFGANRLYLIVIKINQNTYFKIGYTKNKVKDRFTEKRWAGDMKLIEIKREKEFSAKTVKEILEPKLKDIFKDWKINPLDLNITNPGKGEIYDIKYLNKAIEIYDEVTNNCEQIYGITRAN
jgi:hypothetical protein